MKTQERIVVKVDADLEDIVPGFLEGRRKDVTELQQALREGNYETIRILGHMMNGSGGGYGFQAITEIGRHLETAAKESDSETIQQYTDELTSYLERVEIVYQ